MYNLYNEEELVTTTPTLRKAKEVAITLHKSTGKDIFVWRQKKGERAELILEVIDETRIA